MIRGLGASLVAAAVLATTAGARCLDSATAAFGQPGAFGVGVRDLTLVDDTRPTPAHGSQPALSLRTLVTRVWYPTAGPASATPVTDAALLTGKRFGLVVYSHGFGDTPAFAKYLAVPLASRGYVVAAPTFPLTNLATLGSPDGPYPADIVNQPADVSFVIGRLLAADAPADWLAGALDAHKVGLAGLSYGGLTTLLLAYHPSMHDRRVHAALALAPAACALTSRYYRRVGTPLLVMQGDQDQLVPLETNGARAFTFARRSPRELVTLVHGTHTAFAGPIAQESTSSYDTIGCALILRAFTADLLAQFQMATELQDPKTGIDITQCSLPCQAAFPSNPPMQAPRQHALAKAVTAAFFESTLGRSSTARCFLRKGLARENATDVHVSLRGPRR